MTNGAMILSCYGVLCNTLFRVTDCLCVESNAAYTVTLCYYDSKCAGIDVDMLE